jgi:hypothetical protein
MHFFGRTLPGSRMNAAMICAAQALAAPSRTCVPSRKATNRAFESDCCTTSL